MRSINPTKFAVLITALILLNVYVANAQNICLLGVGHCQKQNNRPKQVKHPTQPTSSGETVHRTGRIAKNILAAKAYGSRHLVLLDRYWDQSRRCYIEERAWVGHIRGSGRGGVVATTGPSKRFCVGRNTLSVDQINTAAGWLAYSDKQIYQHLRYKERIAPYLRDSRYSRWAQTEINKVQTNINYYKRYIRDTKSRIDRFVP